jgi:toxin-antitoxin system PIN domain toxin
LILIDANVLLYAHDSVSPHHGAARQWLEITLSGTEPVGLGWITILAFLRISTTRTLLKNPLSPSEAVIIVSEWLQQPRVSILHPGERHWEILRNLIVEGQAPGPLVMDAHEAALAIEHGATLCTTDRDFSRFPGVRVMNPLKNHPRKR